MYLSPDFVLLEPPEEFAPDGKPYPALTIQLPLEFVLPLGHSVLHLREVEVDEAGEFGLVRATGREEVQAEGTLRVIIRQYFGCAGERFGQAHTGLHLCVEGQQVAGLFGLVQGRHDLPVWVRQEGTHFPRQRE